MPAVDFKKFLFPALYILAIVLLAIYAFNSHNITLSGKGSPLYRNLMDYQTYIKRGFVPGPDTDLRELNSDWYRYETDSRSVMYSPLPDLPKRSFLSPRGRDREEFTILIRVEIDSRAVSFLNENPFVIPGVHFAVIGENWEIYFNGALVQSEMYAYSDKNGKLKLKENRTWRNVYFPIDRSLVVEGTNNLVLRVVGDPAYQCTGLSYRNHHYFDDYRIIERRMHRYSLLVLCGIFGFIGIYYLMLFLFIKDTREIFNLYFSIFSILLCIYTFTRHGIVNILIPNADISIRLEYTSMMLMIPMFCMFVESIVRGKITLASRIYLYCCLFLAITQNIFCNQYGEDAVKIWNVTVILYCTYFLFYKLIFYYLWDEKGPRKKPVSGFASYSIINALVGMISLYICGIYEILEVMFFRNDFSFFQYSLFVIHFGMAFNLAHRFSGMYKKLEEDKINLNHTVKERTAELAQQTEIAVELSVAKSKFLATVNNELKLPLENISADIQLAKEKAVSNEARELIQKAWDDTMQMAGNVSNALDELQRTKSSADSVKIGNLSFDLISNRAFYGNIDLPLAPKEFALLYMLARNEGKILSAERLYETVWKMGYNDSANGTLRAHIKNLKKKLDNNACEVFIETARGEGYLLKKS